MGARASFFLLTACLLSYLRQFHGKLLRLHGAEASPCFEVGTVGALTAAEACELESA